MEAEALKILLTFDQNLVSEELDSAIENIDTIEDFLEQCASFIDADWTPENRAAYFHNRLLQASIIARSEYIHEDVALFTALNAAEKVAENAISTSYGKEGRLKEISDEIDKIQAREGLDEEEYWPRGEGPDDYKKLIAESDVLHENIRSTMLDHILRKYRFSEIAELLTKSPIEAIARREAGRRCSSELGKDEIERSNAYLEQQHGEKCIRILLDRLADYKRWSSTSA